MSKGKSNKVNSTKTKPASRLGRGLSALISSDLLLSKADENKAEKLDFKAVENTSLQTVAISDIVPNKQQPRAYFAEDKLQSLAASIKEYGLLQPILVQPITKHGDKQIYQIIAGERRWRACHQANLTEVPVLVCQKELDTATLLKQALVENVQREDLNPIEEAEAYDKLNSEFSLSQAEIAAMTGKSRPVITNMQRLLKLPASVKKLLSEKTLTVGQAKPLLALKDEENCLKLAKLTIENDWSAREVEKKVKELLALAEEEKQEQTVSELELMARREQARLEDRLMHFFGQKVKITEQKGKGKLILAFNNYDELDQILLKIGVKLDD